MEQTKGKYLSDLSAALKSENKRKAVMSIKLGFMSQLKDELYRYVRTVFKKAQLQAAKEIKGKAALADEPGITPEVNSVLAFKLGKVVDDISSSFENNSTLKALTELNNTKDDASVVSEVSATIEGFIESGVPYNSTGAIINEAINTGRNNFFWGNKDIIQGFQFSAILDSRTTPLCASLNGQTFSVNDVDSLDLRPPLHWNCRSILIPITTSQTAPEWTGLEVKPTADMTAQEIIDKYKQF